MTQAEFLTAYRPHRAAGGTFMSLLDCPMAPDPLAGDHQAQARRLALQRPIPAAVADVADESDADIVAERGERLHSRTVAGVSYAHRGNRIQVIPTASGRKFSRHV